MDPVMENLNKLIKFPKKSWLAKQTDLDKDVALSFLLENEEFDMESLNIGFEAALFNMAPKCLECLIKFAKRKGITFSCKNPYPHLFNRKKPSFKNSLVKCTQTLIDNGFDVKERSDLYPLYSLIMSAAWVQSHTPSLEYVCDSLSLLLAAGADPNFRYYGPGEESGCGVKSATATIALACTLGRFRSSSHFHDHCKYFAKVIELLVKHGCDIFENDARTPLLKLYFKKFYDDICKHLYGDYDYEQVSATIPYLYKATGCLIYGGADIHYYRNQWKLLLTGLNMHIICKLLVRRHLREDEEWSEIEQREDESRVKDILLSVLDSAFSFLKFMDVTEAQEVLKESLDAFDTEFEDGELTDLRTVFKDVLLKHFAHFFSLQSLCLVKVWKCAGKRFTELGLPTTVVDSIKNMFHLAF